MRIYSKKVRASLITVVLFSGSCYYDHEALLYPETSNCTAPASPSFSVDVLPLLNNRCNSCHGGVSPSGGVKLDTYNDVSTYATNGRLMGSVNQASGYSPMPQGGGKLSSCEIDKIRNWISSGMLNN